MTTGSNGNGRIQDVHEDIESSLYRQSLYVEGHNHVNFHTSTTLWKYIENSWISKSRLIWVDRRDLYNWILKRRFLQLKSIDDGRMSDMSIGRFSVGYSQVNVQELEGMLINKQNSPILTRASWETFWRSDVRNARMKNWSTTTLDDISFDKVRYHKKQTYVLCTRGCAFDFIV